MSVSRFYRNSLSTLDRTQGSPHSRSSSRSATPSSTRASPPTRTFANSHSASAPGSNPPTQAPLHLTSFISPSGFARPSYAVSPGPRSRGGAAASPNAHSTTPRAARRGESHTSPADQRVSRSRALSPLRRAGQSPMTRSPPATAESREQGLVTPPRQQHRSLPVQREGTQGRSRTQRDCDDVPRPAVSPRRVGTPDAGGSGGAMTVSSNPLYSTLSTSTSARAVAAAAADGGSGRGGAVGAAQGPTPSSSVANPLLRPTGALDWVVESSLSLGGGGGGAAVTPTITTPVTLIPFGPSKEHCSQCKVEDEPLYLCPCGLARYCSTTCQRAHWAFHRAVCCNGVRAVKLSRRSCDWCGIATHTQRKCGCGFAYYCDVHCQRADWPFHRLVCSTVASEAIVEALLGGPAPRTTREAATQTAHWQISVPVFRAQARPDGGSDSRVASGFGSPSLQTSQQYGFTGSDSFGDGRSFDGAATASTTNGSFFPRSNRTQPPPWEHHSQYPGDSVCTEVTSSNSRSIPASPGAHASAAGHVDPVQRISRSRGGSAASPRTSSARHLTHPHPRSSSAYDSLYLTISHPELPSPPPAHYRSDTETVPSANRANGHGSLGFLSGGILGPSSRHSTALSEGEGGEGTGTSNGISPSSSFAPVRDQPSLLAVAATSQRKVENDEQKEWIELCRQFEEERVAIELRILPTLEEVHRMGILKEEVRWCVVTGNPAARRLKQEALGKLRK